MGPAQAEHCPEKHAKRSMAWVHPAAEQRVNTCKAEVGIVGRARAKETRTCSDVSVAVDCAVAS